MAREAQISGSVTFLCCSDMLKWNQISTDHKKRDRENCGFKTSSKFMRITTHLGELLAY